MWKDTKQQFQYVSIRLALSKNELENQHRKHVVSVYTKKTNQRMKIIELIPDALAKVVDGLMLELKTVQVIKVIHGKDRDLS